MDKLRARISEKRKDKSPKNEHNSRKPRRNMGWEIVQNILLECNTGLTRTPSRAGLKWGTEYKLGGCGKERGRLKYEQVV